MPTLYLVFLNLSPVLMTFIQGLYEVVLISVADPDPDFFVGSGYNLRKDRSGSGLNMRIKNSSKMKPYIQYLLTKVITYINYID